jgi:hypothetical protein
VNRPVNSNTLFLALMLPAAGAGLVDILNENTRAAIDRGGWVTGCLIALAISRRLSDSR